MELLLYKQYMGAATPLKSEMESFLQLTAVRQLAVEKIADRLVSDSALVTRFWYQIVSEAVEITIFYSTVRWMGRKYALVEYVAGETLEELVKRSEPSACEREIPLFCKLLDAFEGNAVPPMPRAQDFDLLDFGIGRISRPQIPKAHGAALAGPGGGWAEESFGGTPEITLLLKEFCENILVPKPYAPPVPRSAPQPPVGRAPAWMVAAGTAALVLAVLYGAGNFLASRTEPAKLIVPAAAAASARQQAVEPELPAAPLPTGTVTQIGGPKPVRQSPLVYPESARRQWISGLVEVDLALGSDGAVESATVRSGDPALTVGLTDGLKNWTFRPVRMRGKAVAGVVPIKLRYDLKP